MLVHTFQVIPLMLVLSNFSESYIFKLMPSLSEFYILCGSAVLTFFASLKTENVGLRGLFTLSFTALYLMVINKLYHSPSMGLLLSSLFLVTLYRIKNYPSRMSPSSFSVLWPYLISATFYLSVKFGYYQSPEISLLATNISFASLVFFIGIKTNIINVSRIVASLVIVLSTLVLLFLKQLNMLFLTTDIWFTTVSLLSIIVIFKYQDSGLTNIRKNLFRFPETTLFSYFISLAIVGTTLLQLPVSRANDSLSSVLDSFFTAISAVCVTGLIVFDTPVDFSFFGQLVILILIQMGGFGIVAMSSWVLLGLQSSRMSIEQEQMLQEMSGHQPSLSGIQSTLRRIFLYFISVECLGTGLLYLRFSNYDSDAGEAFWRALFTSISAFCNAGFALQSDSLIPYQTDAYILSVVSFLIIAGGFAPMMALSLPSRIIHGKLNLQDKLVLSTTIGLLAIGFLYFILMEWNHSLKNLGFVDKVINSWFQSVTTRTAGFNSVDYMELAPFTPFFFLALMFIGGNPGGTAGGIKTITFAVLILSAMSGIRGEHHIRIFNRHITSKGVYRTLSIFLVAFLTVSVGFFMLSVTQQIPIVSILFETVSAIGTVGLSIGATAHLDEVGKAIIILCMLLGRVGPLAFILLLFRNQAKKNWKVPKEDVYIS